MAPAISEQKIVIDTNALMAIAEMNIDIFSELENCCDFPFKIYVLNSTIRELEAIQQQQRGKYKQAATLALIILEAKNIECIEHEGYVDDILVELSKQHYLVLTQDQNLKRRLQKPYLTIRQKKRIVVVK